MVTKGGLAKGRYPMSSRREKGVAKAQKALEKCKPQGAVALRQISEREGEARGQEHHRKCVSEKRWPHDKMQKGGGGQKIGSCI